MATIREILIEWNTDSGSGKRSVLYFNSAPTVASQRTAINAFLTSIKIHLSPATQFGIQQSGVELDSQTGALVGSWAHATNLSGNGTGSGSSVPDAAQALVQWKTPAIVNGRFLRGRTFIPGVLGSLVVAGNLNATVIATFGTAASTLVASGADLHVWHRPISGSGGTSVAANSASIWPELAVLRRRRG